MTDQELELYQRTVADCNAVADSMDPDDGLRWSFRTLATVLEHRLPSDSPPQPHRSTRPRSPRGQLHAVPTQG
jgi:hypothetical protein